MTHEFLLDGFAHHSAPLITANTHAIAELSQSPSGRTPMKSLIQTDCDTKSRISQVFGRHDITAPSVPNTMRTLRGAAENSRPNKPAASVRQQQKKKEAPSK